MDLQDGENKLSHDEYNLLTCHVWKDIMCLRSREDFCDKFLPYLAIKIRIVMIVIGIIQGKTGP